MSTMVVERERLWAQVRAQEQVLRALDAQTTGPLHEHWRRACAARNALRATGQADDPAYVAAEAMVVEALQFMTDLALWTRQAIATGLEHRRAMEGILAGEAEASLAPLLDGKPLH